MERSGLRRFVMVSICSHLRPIVQGHERYSVTKTFFEAYQLEDVQAKSDSSNPAEQTMSGFIELLSHKQTLDTN
jgi:hypothetical protein